MKVSSRSEQKYVTLNKYYYNDYSIRKLLKNCEICYFDDDFNQCYDYFYSGKRLAVFLEKGDEIKVGLVEGCYTNILIKPDGRKYFITL